jgi:protein-S-isoprenylcysteine O-methyltransferase Ste14
VGPKLALSTLPALVVAVAVTVLFRYACRLVLLPRGVELGLGVVLLATGLVFYGSAARSLMRGFREGVLVTGGVFAWSQNPLYASFIFFLIPAAALLADSWPLVVASLVLYVAFKRFIVAEYREMEAAFGEQYRAYRSKTSELLPLPPHPVGHSKPTAHA